MNTVIPAHKIHPDAFKFPSCPFGYQGGALPGGRVRKEVGDRFCNDPDNLFCPTTEPQQWSPASSGEDLCERCGSPRQAHVKRQLVVLAHCAICKWANFNGPPPAIPPKVGDVLARILKDRRNANASETCDCASHIQEMNNWGPDGCEENFATILGWLLEAASETPGIHRWIPEFVKATVLEGDIREAIKEVRDWTPPASDAPAGGISASPTIPLEQPA